MSYAQVSAGQKAPDDVNVIIEISAFADPVKYEVDKETDHLHVDRFVSTAMRYPCNYGYIPKTHSEDGDPVDVLVVTPFPVQSGAVIRCRPIGVLVMADEAGQDAKVLSVPVPSITRMYAGVHAPEDLPEVLLARITHFFEHYKDLESGKWVKLEGWLGKAAAEAEIMAGIERFQAKQTSAVE